MTRQKPSKQNKKKLPKNYGKNTKISKVPKVSKSFEERYTENPVWQLGDIDLDGPFGWRGLEIDFLLSEILPKIQNFESMKWSEILGPNNHEVRISGICSEAQKRLAKLGLDDLERLVSLRLTGPKRLWGIKNHNTMRILWWDPDHKVFPSKLKHT